MKKAVLIPIEKYDRWMKLIQQETPKPEGEISPRHDITVVRAASPIPTEDKVTHKLNEAVIVSALPKNCQHKMKSLLDLIESGIKWNERGEVFIRESFIPGSHIVDLLKDVCRQSTRFTPRGANEFYQLLRERNVPLSFITNTQRLRGLRAEEHPPSQWITL